MAKFGEKFRYQITQRQNIAMNSFVPKLFTILREGISKEQLTRDLLSGTIVGIVALPLAIAFAIASGVSPEKGLITAVFAGLVISAFGGSRVQIGGPTGAFIVIVYQIVEQHGVNGLTIATFIAGFLIMLMGFLKLGRLLKYFPYTLIVGFTTGIAVIIFSSQIKDFLGLEMGEVPAGFIEKWISYGSHLTSVNLYSVGIGIATILISLNFARITTKVPGSLVAIVLCTLAVFLFHLPVETIESRFGTIPNTLPTPRLIWVDFETFKSLLQPALAIALLGGIESLLSAVVADGMIGGNHRSNMELVAQGGANIVSAVFGGIPATGAIARTATNVKNGGRTPISGIVHAMVLFLIMLFASPLAKLIPLACLAGILVVVAWNMSELHNFISIMKTNRHDAVVLLTTFFLTVVFDLVIAIEIGMVLAAVLFMHRMSEATELGQLLTAKSSKDPDLIFEKEVKKIPKEVLIYEVNGPLFFGAAQKFFDTLRVISDTHKVLILRIRNVPMIDATGLKRMKDIIHLMHERKIEVILSGANAKVAEEILKLNLIDEKYLKPGIEAAIEEAEKLIGK